MAGVGLFRSKPLVVERRHASTHGLVVCNRRHEVGQAKTVLIVVLAGSSQVGLDNVFGFFMDGAAITAGRFRERFMRLH